MDLTGQEIFWFAWVTLCTLKQEKAATPLLRLVPSFGDPIHYWVMVMEKGQHNVPHGSSDSHWQAYYVTMQTPPPFFLIPTLNIFPVIYKPKETKEKVRGQWKCFRLAFTMPTLEKVQMFQAKTRKKEPINYNVFDWQLQILPATVALIILDKILVHYFFSPHISTVV